MRLNRTAIVVLLAAYCVAICPVVGQESAQDVKQIEEYWPDGQLQLRKQVLRLDDGTTVDHGSFVRWHDNGKKEYEATFVLGKKEGTTTRFHKNGQKANEQQYKDGKRHGRCLSWDASGVLVKEENWAEGKPHGVWVIWQDGEVKWTHTFEQGTP